MLSKKQTFFTLLFIAILLNSCTDNSSMDKDGCPLTSINTMKTENTINYEYDNAGKITNFNASIKYDSIKYQAEAFVSYDSDGRINRIEIDNKNFCTIGYTDTSMVISKTSEYWLFSTKDTYILDDMDRIVELYQSKVGSVISPIRFEYNHDNLIFKTYFRSSGKWVISNEKEYDKKINPLAQIPYILQFTISGTAKYFMIEFDIYKTQKNNVTHTVRYDLSGTVSGEQKIEYEYDQSNRPFKGSYNDTYTYDVQYNYLCN